MRIVSIVGEGHSRIGFEETAEISGARKVEFLGYLLCCKGCGKK